MKKEVTSFLMAMVFLSLALIVTGLILAFVQQPNQSTTRKPTPDSKPFEQFSAQVTELVQTKDPTAALTFIEKEIQTNQKMMELCHPLVHLTGHLAYEKYGDFAKAITYQDDICGSGYLHGVIERKFVSIKDPVTEMRTICSDVPKEDLDTCYHGVGHGLMYYYENDIPRSIAMCQNYRNANAITRCAEGVYMENFSTTKDSLHSTQYLKDSEPFYPCAEQPESLKNVCYFYTSIYYLHLHPNQYNQGLEHCLQAEPKHQYACAKGIGSRVMKENLTDIAFDESVCNQAPASLRVPCIEGLTSYHLVNFDSQVKTKAMCQQLQPDNQETCVRYVSQRTLSFGE
jgi:hypothetical protein